jgi:hypothetical protein
MTGLIRIFLIGFLFSNIVSCNEKKAGNELLNLDFSLVKGFVSDTNYYEYAYFKMRVFNNNSQLVRLYIEKSKVSFAPQNVPGQKKSGSIFMLDSNRNKLNELLLWPVYPNELIIKANRSLEFLLRASTTGLVNPGENTNTAGFQTMLTDLIRSRLYSYYSLNNNGAVNDSAVIRVDSNFLMEYRAPD